VRVGELIGLSEPLAFTNGLFPIDEGRTMLVAETPAMRLVALPVLTDGRLGPPRPWAPWIEPWLWKAALLPRPATLAAPSRTGTSWQGSPTVRS
jgi:hypothetical protein